MRFTLSIDSGNAAMTNGADVAERLRHVGHLLGAGHTSGAVTDGNGNTIGQWTLDTTTQDTFTTQEGAIFSMDGATCPNGHASSLDHRSFPSGYFNCPDCGVMYDEPTFAEHSFVGELDDDAPSESLAETRARRRAAQVPPLGATLDDDMRADGDAYLRGDLDD
jgi:hypothetical protein